MRHRVAWIRTTSWSHSRNSTRCISHGLSFSTIRRLEDVRVYGLAPRTYPLYLAFLGDIDGDANAFLGELIKRAGKGLGKIFSCCEGFTSGTDLLTWMKQHDSPAIAAYVNWRGRTVRQIREEEALYEALENYIEKNAAAFRDLPPRELHAKLQSFVESEKSAGRLTLSGESPTPVGWQIKNLLHMIGLPLLVLIASPLAHSDCAILSHSRFGDLEKTDPEVCPDGGSETLRGPLTFRGSRRDESVQRDGKSQARFGATADVRHLCSKLSNYAARHITRPGTLGRIRSIHFARWVFVAGRERMIFFSNYDGSVESYMDDFINKTGFGLNASFSNGIGYPRTNWLVADGCVDERNYKEFLRRHTLPTQVWYKAYPGLTAVDLDRNTRIRKGLESSLTNEQAREWTALL